MTDHHLTDDPSDVTTDLALRSGRRVAAGTVDRVVVGRDARRGGDLLVDALTTGLREAGATVLDLGVVATPTVARAVGWHDADAGVAVTHDAGLLRFDDRGRVDRTHRQRETDGGARTEPPGHSGRRRRVEDAADHHVETLVAERARLDGLSVVVDVGNGCGSLTARALTRLGCDVWTLNAQVDGAFPGRHPAPTDEHCGQLRSMVTMSDADFGIAHDADGDRAMAVTGDGRFVSGAQLCALFVGHATPEDGQVVVAADAGREVFEAAAAPDGALGDRVLIDDAPVDRAIREGAAFGADERGRWVWPDETACSDGAAAALRLADVVDGSGPLADLVGALPDYRRVSETVPVDRPRAVASDVERRCEDRYARVFSGECVRVVTEDGGFAVAPAEADGAVAVSADGRSNREARAHLDAGRELVDECRREKKVS